MKENVAPNHNSKSAPYGSGYKRLKKAIDESLRDWFKKEDWVRINTSGNISGKCGTMKKGKATTRCLPKKNTQTHPTHHCWVLGVFGLMWSCCKSM